MGGKVIAAGLGLLVGLVGGAAAAWGLDPADEPEPTSLPTTDEAVVDEMLSDLDDIDIVTRAIATLTTRAELETADPTDGA